MPRPDRLIRSASFRLAALQTVLFLVVFVAAGAAAFVMIRRAEFSAARAEMVQYEDDTADDLHDHGLPALVAKAGRRRDPGRDFRLQDASGRVLAGGLPAPPRVGAPWSTYATPDGRVLAFTKIKKNGMVLTVGEYLAVRERKDDALLLASIGLAALVAGLGLAGGVLVGRRIQQRVDQIGQAVARYADGERAVRAPVGRDAGGDLDELAHAVNDLMERENRLIEGLRQVSTAIAHDLRRPLAHHNQEIASALAGPPSPAAYRAALEAAGERVEEVLQTFQSLLHIAELEAGAPGLGLEPVEVNAVARRIVDAYLPMAEEGGRALGLEVAGPPLQVVAEPRILGRALANLVENALVHTPAGSQVMVAVDGAARRLTVRDDGPGVPEAAQRRIFERFFRLDTSRTTPGSGLGLALAAATLQAFGGTMWAEDAEPGLRIVAAFEADNSNQ